MTQLSEYWKFKSEHKTLLLELTLKFLVDFFYYVLGIFYKI